MPSHGKLCECARKGRVGGWGGGGATAPPPTSNTLCYARTISCVTSARACLTFVRWNVPRLPVDYGPGPRLGGSLGIRELPEVQDGPESPESREAPADRSFMEFLAFPGNKKRN